MVFDPLRDPDDTVSLGGRDVPGIVKIVGLSAPRDFDERRGFGMAGARLVYRGQKLSRFSLNVSLYTQEHWDDWRDFSDIVRRPPPPDRASLAGATSIPALQRAVRGRANPLRIRHPLLEEYRVSQVVVEDVTAPVEDETGVWSIEIKLIQYEQPRRVLASISGRPQETRTPSRQDQQIAALTAQLDQLAAEGNR